MDAPSTKKRELPNQNLELMLFYDTEKVAKTNTKSNLWNWIFEMKRLGKRFWNSKTSIKVMVIWFCSRFFIFISAGRKSRIVGKNGAGKSTLLNIIQGLEPKDSGEIETGKKL